MERDRFRHAVHGQIAEDIAGLLTGLFDAVAPESHFGIFLHAKKLRTAQMIVAFYDSSVDAADVNFCHDRRFFEMLAVDVDLALEFREFSVRGAEKLTDAEADRGAGLIEFVGFIGKRA